MVRPLLWGLHLRKNRLRKAARATITKRNWDKNSADGTNHRTIHANHRRIHPAAEVARGERIGGMFLLVETWGLFSARGHGVRAPPLIRMSRPAAIQTKSDS